MYNIWNKNGDAEGIVRNRKGVICYEFIWWEGISWVSVNFVFYMQFGWRKPFVTAS